MIRRTCRSLLVGAVTLLVVACGDRQELRPEIKLNTAEFTFRVTADRMPPTAREDDRFRVEVVDRETRQPVQGGEGRIFATSQEGMNSWDGFALGEEPGVYYGTLRFLTAGQWAMAIQFRTDSTKPLQRADWVQDVLPERPLGEP